MGPSTVAVNTEGAIRSRIATGEIQPDQWLREVALAEALGVSRTPVREACARLARDGLLEWVPNRGYRVPPLDPQELEEVYPVLMSLEELAVTSLTGSRPALVEQLRAEEMKLTARAGDAEALFAADRAWHRCLVAAAGNSVLLASHDRLVDRLERYLLAYWGKRADVEASDREHNQIVVALESNDLLLAAALLRLHRRQGLSRIHRLMSS